MDEDVNITVEADEPPAAAEPAPPVVTVVETDNGTDAGNTDAVVELAARVGSLEAWREQMSEQVAEVEVTAEQAETIAEIAEDTAIASVQVAETTAEESEEDTEESDTEDEPPARVHWTHRSMRDLFGGNR